MGKQKKTRKYATMKRMLSLRDQRLKEKDRLKPKKKEKKDPSALKEREVPQHPSCLFFQYNTQLGPPYHILVDTNFINFSIKAKLDLVQSMMDCLYAKCIPCITDCVMAEIEKLGQKYRVALRIAKDPRFERLPCTHKGTYADDCLVQRVTQHKCYIVATVDRDLKRRIRKIPGVPIMYISNHRCRFDGRSQSSHLEPRDGSFRLKMTTLDCLPLNCSMSENELLFCLIHCTSVSHCYSSLDYFLINTFIL
nr:rRNA-processing protein FCF1 homolog isoform X1 [Globicephala melas]